MKIVDITNSVIYTDLTSNVIDFFLSNKNKAAIVSDSREIKFDRKEKTSEFDFQQDTIIDDFTDEETGLFVEKVIEVQGEIDSRILDYIKENSNLAVYKKIKCKEVDAIKVANIESGVEYEGNTFQSDKYSRDLLTSTVLSYQIQGEVPEGFTWISSDNKEVSVDLEDLIAIGNLMGAKLNEETHKAREIKNKILEAKSITAIEKIKY